jgi:uncharacterized protein (TIGR02145 family)
MIKTYKILLSFFLILMSGMGFTQSVPSYVPTNGLVGWWGFNGNAQDNSGNGNHGTVNGATLTTDRFGNQNGAYDFTVSNYITVFGLYQTDILQYTIASWFKKSSLNSNTDGTVVSGSNLQQSPSGIRLNMGTINRFQFQVEDSPGQNGIIELFPGVNVNYCDGQWHHVVGTFYAQSGAIPSSSFKLYIDGVEVSTISNFMNWPSWDTTTYAPVNNGGRSVIIGNSGPNFTGGFLGELDDIGIWNRALTPQEITNLYNSQLPTQTSLCLPTITTSSPNSVGVDTVVIGGDISNDGGSSIVLRGVCYSTSPNPNMGNQRTEDGSGTGSFNTVLRDLTSSTTYYARSYAKNSNGVVVYGNEVSFTTIASLPGVRCPGTPTVTDIDGNVYNTVQIGGQCWTQSNLKTSRYRNGDTIPTGLSNSDWWSTQFTNLGAYQINYNISHFDSIYGKLYNHYAVTDNRGICPTGWHVPSKSEFDILVYTLEPGIDTSFVGWSGSLVGGLLKSTALSPTIGGWLQPNTGANNLSGFLAMPSGFADMNGGFLDVGSTTSWWTSTDVLTYNAWYRGLSHNRSSIDSNNSNRAHGVPVRCLKN